MSLSCTADAVETTRLVYGGSAVKTEQCAFPAVAIVCAGTFEASDAAAEPQVTQINCSGSCSCRACRHERCRSLHREPCRREASSALAAASPPLTTSPPLKACRRARRGDRLHPPRRGGRALVQQGSLYRRFRRYDKPNFYLAIGISGQIQHMVGVNQTNVICAINKDENAPHNKAGRLHPDRRCQRSPSRDNRKAWLRRNVRNEAGREERTTCTV